MPIVQIEALPQVDDLDVEGALKRLCAELAQLLGEPLRGTWATWRTLERYVEGEQAAETQQADTHPPLVRLTSFEGKPPERVAAMLECVARVLERELRLEPGNVFVTYEEMRRGRLYTGGEVVG